MNLSASNNARSKAARNCRELPRNRPNYNLTLRFGAFARGLACALGLILLASCGPTPGQLARHCEENFGLEVKDKAMWDFFVRHSVGDEGRSGPLKIRRADGSTLSFFNTHSQSCHSRKLSSNEVAFCPDEQIYVGWREFKVSEPDPSKTDDSRVIRVIAIARDDFFERDNIGYSKRTCFGRDREKFLRRAFQQRGLTDG